ncbi:sugar ABC transporter substrate-binding protein [Effusibacillus lacus]|uniref:Sugar ABC transporter substrate-binding protein n=1 Tax=Effusibacillus lacus TaxID=1348429 RepID=A0A292YM12_9BACL|nr:extracellular solute-binding protein [Effusibacillus lacus]TCS73598.1 carbohydrate ABC transporter substrate-binding protein (CUT1 family) [Effusibacillus lacus]GAX89510.1 sugar ABC transporter substrate-binding protein [Effusibacillus lacus]
MDKKWKRALSVTMGAALTLSLVAGCAGGKKEEGQPQQGGQGGQKVLRVAMGLGEDEWKVMRSDVIPKFEQANNVKVEAVQVEAKDVVEKLAAQQKANKVEIDLITQDVNELYALVDRGIVEDLSANKNIIPDTAIKGMIEAGTFENKLMFLPYRPNVEIAFYNEKKFQDAGLTPPKTWDDLLNVARTFKDKEKVGRVAIKANLEIDNTLHIFDFVRAAGGDPYVLNDEGSVKAFTFMQQLYPHLSPDSKRANWNFMNQFLATESVYLGQNWPFGVNKIVKEGGKKEIKAYSGWRGPVKESHTLGGEVIGIPKGSPNKDLALKFAEYLMSKDVQETLVSKLGWPSVRTDAYGKVEDWQKPYFEAVNSALQYASPRGNVPYWPTVNQAILDAFKDIVVGGKPVKETLDIYAKKIADVKK